MLTALWLARRPESTPLLTSFDIISVHANSYDHALALDGKTPAHHALVDARGLHCPLPILRAKKGLAALHVGQVLKVQTTDPGAAHDFQAFCQQTGHALLLQREPPELDRTTDPVTEHWIAKRSRAAQA